MKKLIILLICITFFSCKRNKSLVEYRETLRVDTFKIEREVEKLRAVHDTLTIDNPCDSAGILNTFYSKLVTPQGSIIIRSTKGKIQATIDLDSISQVYESKYKSYNKKQIEYINKEVIKYRVPTWVVILLLVEALALIAWVYIKFIFKGL